MRIAPGIRQVAALSVSLAGLAWSADPAPEVRIATGTGTAWTGQRIAFTIELRAPGTFDGSAAFDIPEVPGTAILKVGNPVLGSDSPGEVEFFTQRHSFSAFSQVDGTLAIPPITVRFRHHRGYTGPVFDAALETEPLEFTIRRPPGSEDLGFLVTTRDIAFTESWEPEPGPAEAGAIFTRTITQESSGLTGMTLAPAPRDAPEGVRLYEPRVEVNDATQRGEFTGHRTETLTYLFEEAGTRTLPEITFTWWDPEDEKLESHTLPAVTFEITPSPRSADPAGESRSLPRPALVTLALFAILAAVAATQRGRIRPGAARLRAILFPPERRAARHLLRACQGHNADTAYPAWLEWRRLWPGKPTPALEAATRDLMRVRFGPGEADPWNGDALAAAVREARGRRTVPAQPAGALPPLNP